MATKGSGSAQRLLDWELFLQRLHAAAFSQLPPAWRQERYVEQVGRLAAKLDLLDPEFKDRLDVVPRDILEKRSSPVFKTLDRTATVQVELISFEDGHGIPLHDHPGMTGVMTCVAGELMVDRYDLVGPGTGPNRWAVEEIGQVRMTQGDISTLTAQRHNIHALTASRFSQVIDIFTPPYNMERIQESQRYRFDEDGPNEGSLDGRRVLEAISSSW